MVRLECLHNHGFAHKDVKSGNICIDNNGDFVLIDFGSTVKFGSESASSFAYVPADIDVSAGATALIDWWMFAMTVYERMQSIQKGLKNEMKMSSSELLDWFESAGYHTLLTKIRSKVTQC